MISKMSYIGNWYIKKPYHNIVPFLINFQRNVNPIDHHQQSNKQNNSAHYERNRGVKVQCVRIINKSGINAINIIGKHRYYR